MTFTSCGQSEAEYQATEERMRQEWDPEKAERDQMRDWRIPSWMNAPKWANWLGFCQDRGWYFAEKQPETVCGGVMIPTSRYVRACEVEGVQFFSNKNKTLGDSAPFWLMDRRAGKTRENIQTPKSNTARGRAPR